MVESRSDGYYRRIYRKDKDENNGGLDKECFVGLIKYIKNLGNKVGSRMLGRVPEDNTEFTLG